MDEDLGKYIAVTDSCKKNLKYLPNCMSKKQWMFKVQRSLEQIIHLFSVLMPRPCQLKCATELKSVKANLLISFLC